MRQQIGVLLIGYDRKDFLLENFRTLIEIDVEDILFFVAIDGPTREKKGKVVNYLDLSEKLRIDDRDKVTFLFRQENLGCDLHIPESIKWVLETCNSVFVIEDDVRFSKESFEEMIKFSETVRMTDETSPIVALSGIRKFGPFKINFWRKSPYFTAWGFAITRDFWKLHLNLRDILSKRPRIENSQFIDQEILGNSIVWKSLSERRKKLWLERFTRGNYDYQIQLTMWANNFLSYAPACRLVDNVGHGTPDATHTKYSTPKFLRKQALNRFKFLNANFQKFNFINRVFAFFDSSTWGGDNLFSPRGRNIGLRTFLRGILNNAK